jgi:hypothetical protein
MKKTAITGLVMMCASSTAMAYGYDYVDEMTYREMANINAQEQADVMHELPTNWSAIIRHNFQQPETVIEAVNKLAREGV